MKIQGRTINYNKIYAHTSEKERLQKEKQKMKNMPTVETCLFRL
jgi:hypothetical protein